MDLYHARQYLHDLALLLEFMPGDQGEHRLAARLEDLDYGDIDGICAARAYPLAPASGKTRWTRPWATSRTRAPQARQVIPLPRLSAGSGLVEAGCKTIIGQRLKLSGMHWPVPGADAITALRCRQAGSAWEAICMRPRTQTETA